MEGAARPEGVRLVMARNDQTALSGTARGDRSKSQHLGHHQKHDEAAVGVDAGDAGRGCLGCPFHDTSLRRRDCCMHSAAPGSTIKTLEKPMLTVDPHPLLDLRAFTTTFPRPLGELATPPAEVLALFDPAAVAPIRADDPLREAVRALLRHGGFRPAGRSKPASEYLLKAATDGPAGIDQPGRGYLQRRVAAQRLADQRRGSGPGTRPPLRVGIAPAGSSYVFNAAGQTIDLGGLLCLHDADGPCANAVKDAAADQDRSGDDADVDADLGHRRAPGARRGGGEMVSGIAADVSVRRPMTVSDASEKRDLSASPKRRQIVSYARSSAVVTSGTSSPRAVARSIW